MVKYCDTFEGQIYVGLKEGYDGKTHTIKEVEDICQEYVNDKGWCVTVTPTKYIYKDGNEKGVIIGVINYPRFPRGPVSIWYDMMILAQNLMGILKQHRVSVKTSTQTYMLENPEYVKKGE